jgi:hypothetical protein
MLMSPFVVVVSAPVRVLMLGVQQALEAGSTCSSKGEASPALSRGEGRQFTYRTVALRGSNGRCRRSRGRAPKMVIVVGFIIRDPFSALALATSKVRSFARSRRGRRSKVGRKVKRGEQLEQSAGESQRLDQAEQPNNGDAASDRASC